MKRSLKDILRSLNKRSETWEEKHPKGKTALIWFSIVIFSVSVVILMYAFAIPFGLITILSNDALRALIEGEATVLGFFGLFAVYALYLI